MTASTTRKKRKSVAGQAVRVMNVLSTAQAGDTVLDTCPDGCTIRACIGRFCPCSRSITRTYVHAWCLVIAHGSMLSPCTCIILCNRYVNLHRRLGGHLPCTAMNPMQDFGPKMEVGRWMLRSGRLLDILRCRGSHHSNTCILTTGTSWHTMKACNKALGENIGKNPNSK